MVTDELRRLRQLKQENARLKKLLAERDLEVEVMKEINVKKVVSVPDRRRLISYAQSRRISIRRACRLMQIEAIKQVTQRQCPPAKVRTVSFCL